MRQHLLALSLAVAAAVSVAGCDKVRQPVAPEGGGTAATGCAQCHGGEGGDTSGAPPRALFRAVANPWAVGAHRAHLGKDVRCEDCHIVPSRVADGGHLTGADGTPDPDDDLAEVPFPAASRARLGGATPAWSRASGTCSGVYCHGAKLATPPAAPSWTGGAMTCGSCHGAPPPSHVGAMPLTRCVECHPATTNAQGGIVTGGGHINGIVDLDPANACTTCHGDGARAEAIPLNKAAPPPGTAGSPNANAVGAHDAHLHDGLLAKAFACAECHAVPGAADVLGHYDTGTRAEVTWDTAVLAGAATATPTWSTATGRCSGVYCHGATLSGGSNKTPLWSGGPGQVGNPAGTLAQRCGVCHGGPPASPHPAVDQAGAALTTVGQCADCHPGTVDQAGGEINVAGGLHVNGRVDLGNFHPANFANPANHGPEANANLGACRTCHGATFGGDVGPSCNACHETAGHANWLTECTFCHGNGARASQGGFAQAGNPPVALDQAAPPVGTQGEQTGSQVAVGAHLAHLDAAGFTRQIQCTECHGASLPTNADHANASVALGWGPLATARGAVPTPSAFDAAWENDPNCTNYCHGSRLQDFATAPRINPSWVVAADGDCNTCHLMRPGNWHPSNSTCADCHGVGYVSTVSADPQKHVNGTIDVTTALGCTSCHGTAGATGPGSAAPPRATDGATSRTAAKVGAHQAHVTGTTRRATALGCADCHGTLPGSMRHANNLVNLAWSTLTQAASATVTPAAGTLPAGWEATPTCTNYCHGNTLAGGSRTTPSWTTDTAASAAGCGACHGAPPPYTAAGNFHVENATCGACHTGYTATTIAPATLAQHINGTLNVVARTCTTCHSNGGATFTATDGSAAAAGNRVGAHVAHGVAGPLAGAFACADCHGAPPTAMNHASGAVNVAWSALAATGTTPTPPAGTVPTNSAVTCANYCHGATLSANAGGAAVKTVSWTGGAAAVACGTCHFVNASTLPAASTHPRTDSSSAPITGAAQCGQCHPDTMTGSAINVAGGRHVNGVVDGGGAPHAVPYPPLAHSVAFEANQAACTGCHGGDYATLVGTPAKSCNTCHAAPATFGYVGVANAQWATDCTFCHGSAARAADAAFANAGTPARALNQVAPPEALTDGVVSTGVVQVGAHQAHVSTTLATKIQCTACHGTPIATNLTHMNGSVALGWSTLATGGAAVVAAPAVFNAVWEASPTCTNYCHGATLAGGTRSAGVLWTGGALEAACGTCHATPLPYTAAGGFHVQNTNCGACHTGYTLSTVTAATHVNGTTNVQPMNCLTCHSLTASAGAPFSGTDGSTATTNNRAGAHTAHVVTGPFYGASIGCTACHGALPGSNTHANGTVSLAWSTLAATGTTPTPPAGTVVTNSVVTCANYCHGATLPVAEFGGTNKNPAWSGGAAAGACGTCHFSTTVPATSTRHPSPGVTLAATDCATCHPDTVNVDGSINTTGGRHINGAPDATGAPHAAPYPAAQHSVAWVAGPAGCQGCHGATYGTLVPTTGGNASCNTCHANPAAFGYTGTANASWQTDCTFCHGSTATAADASYALAGTPAFRLNQIAPPQAFTDGVTSTTFVEVGAHQKHFTTTTSAKVACQACHGTTVPADLAHANGATALGWSTVSTGNGAVTPAPAAFNAAWEATPTCTNYCHGGTGSGLTGGTITSPRWTVAADGACGTCHFVANTAATGTHLSHVNNAAVLGANFTCQDCHASVVNAANAIVGAALHVNGTDTVSMTARGTQSNGAYVAGSCAASYCHSSGQATPTFRSIAWTAGAIGCNGCHGTGNAAGAPDYASGAAGSATANDHAAHTAAGATSCQNCHSGLVTAAGTAIAGALHINGTREVAILAAYDANGATVNYNPATKTCSSVNCHGSGAPQWGGGPLKCSDCHAAAGTGADVDSFAFGTAGIISTTEWAASGHGQPVGALFTAATVLPTIAAGQPCLYCHDGSVTHSVATNPFRLRGASLTGGATFNAYNGASANNGNEVCLNCHGTGSFGVNAAAQGLKNGTLKVDSWHAGAKHVTNVGGRRCWDCHDPHGDGNIQMVGKKVVRTSADNYSFNATRVPATGTLSFTARATGTDFANATGTGVCNVCHTTAAHYTATSGDGHNAGTACTSCHAHDQPATNTAFAVPIGGGSCVGCHTTGGSAVPGRRDVVAEFKLTWSHKASTNVATPASRVVTDFDCAVCHMEGDPATGATTSFHQGSPGGLINLRNPDTGLHIKGVTFTLGTGPGAYASTGVDLSFTQFRRNLSSATLEAAVTAVMINQCLACHDANGAAVTRVPAASGGTAEKPFGVSILRAGSYVGVGVTANGRQGAVTDINAAFAVTNSSYHPVRGANNNWYAKLTRMAAPWNAATRGATVNLTSWGPLLSCWDCHASVGATGTITQTLTAHGGSVTLRGNATISGTPAATTNEATLCKVCHALYNTNTGSNHGANSAFTSNANGGMTNYLRYGCNACHASNYSAAVARPVRGIDVHGVNTLPTGGLTKASRWATANAVPYAFIRNTTFLTNHQPQDYGATNGTSGSCSSTAGNPCSDGMGSYTVGGTY